MPHSRSVRDRCPSLPVGRSPKSGIPTVVFLLALVGSAAWAPTGASQSFEEGGGFQSNHLFLNGPGGDSISPFSGDLELVVPIGPTLRAGGSLELGLSLHYSSKIWRVWSSVEQERHVTGRGPFGLGWKLHVGRVFSSCRNGCNYDFGLVGDKEWIYESPDGAEHPIAYGVPSGGAVYDGTTDSTFIRAEALDAAGEALPATGNVTEVAAWRLFLGNGLVHTFERRLEQEDGNHASDQTGDFRGWYATRIERWDSPLHPVGRIAIRYDTGSKAHCISSIEFYGPGAFTTPQRAIGFVNLDMLGSIPVEGGFTKEIHVPAVDGQLPSTAVYRFDYSGPHTVVFNVDPSRPDLNKASGGHLLLAAVHFPDPGQGQPALPPLRFAYDLEPAGDGVTGELIRKELPAGAAVQYDYGVYSYNVTQTTNVFLREVVTKKLFLDATADPESLPSTDPQSPNPGGVWRYWRSRGGGSHPAYTRVTDPFGNDTVFLFGQSECPLPECEAWTTGLVTSVKVFQGPASWNYGGMDFPQTGHVVRVRKTRFTTDDPPEDPRGRNILVTNSWSQDERGNLAGNRRLNRGPFGHFDFKETYGSGVPTRRAKLTYEDVVPGGILWRLWSIHRVVEKVVSEADGPPLRKATWSLTVDGRPLTQTAFADPAGADPLAAENLVTRFLYDAATMNMERSFSYKAGAPAPAYGSRLGYATGVFVSATQHLDPGNPEAASSQAFSWLSRDVTHEARTGAVVVTRDAAGVRTDSFFDRLGRIVAIVPAAPETPTRVSYPSVRETMLTRGEPASQNFVQTRYLYDPLGRVVEIRIRTQTGCEAFRKTRYDVAGRVELAGRWRFDDACSEEQKSAEAMLQPGCPDGTEFFYWTGQPTARQYDALGRIQKVTAPDCKSTTMAYAGTASVVTVQEVGDQGPSSITFERDVYGNLLGVNGPEGADARYTYSPLGELEQVELAWADPNQVVWRQQRRTVYDAFGRPVSATNPENGTVRFTRYDSAGRVLEKIDSDGTKLSFTFDAAGRLLAATAADDVTDPQTPPDAPRSYAPAVTLAEYVYDESGGPAEKTAGRLTRVEGNDETGRLASRRRLVYGGLNGRVSEEVTTFALWDGREGIQAGFDKEFRTCYVHDDDGLLIEQRYPHEAACQSGSAPAGVARLTYAWRNGALEAITDANRGQFPATSTPLILSVLHSAAGGVVRIGHGNGTTTTVLPDVMHRVGSITVDPSSPGEPLFRTGLYTYDGAGNITGIGDPGDPNRDVFYYDRLSRLTRADVHYSEDGASHLVRETYEFDGFGNLTGKHKVLDPGPSQQETATSLDASPLTNRLMEVNGSPAAYDQRGNLLAEQDRPFLFDTRNRLVAAGDPGKAFPVGLYAYDAGGLRYMKVMPETGERIFYVRDASGSVLSELTVPPRKYDEYHQKDYFHALGRVLGMAEEEAPAPVEGLVSSMLFYPGEELAPGYGVVTLRWLANAETGLSGYRIFRRGVGDTTWQNMGEVAALAEPTWSQLVVGTGLGADPYYYRVAAVRMVNQEALEGIPSRAIKVVVGEPAPGGPASPQGLVLQRRERSLTLRWQQEALDAGYAGGLPQTALVGYNVYRRVDGAGDWERRNAQPLVEPFFHDLKADDPARTYQYQVRTLDSTGAESAGSFTSTVSPGDDTPPAPPAGVRALSGPGAGQVTVVWSGSAESDLAGYRVYQKQGAAYTLVTPVLLGVATRTHTLEGLAARQSYAFAVTATDAVSESALSADASAKPRLAALDPPPSQTGSRELSWTEPATAAVRLDWGSSLEAARYKVYRKRDEEPWWAYRPAGSTTTALTYKDTLIDRCAAYTYMVRAADEDGNESADPGLEVFVDRIFRPAAPEAVGDPVNTTITISWEGLEGCVPEAHGFELTGWRIRTSADKPYVVDGWVTIADPAQRSYTFTDIGPTQIVGFAVSARLRSVYHAGDPTDPAHAFDSFLSEDLCATTMETLAEGSCPDLAFNDPSPPGGGGGGGGIPEPQQDEVRRIPPHWHGPTHAPPAGGGFAALAPLTHPASGARRQELTGDAPHGPPRSAVASAFSISVHRVIGAPSPKRFRFSYFHHDHLGSVRVVTDVEGVKRSEAKNLPFGDELTASGGEHRFTAHQRDDETGLDYMLARYYSATLSRFTSGDPVPTGNLYAYVYGNPVLLSDPTGMTAGGNPHAEEDERDRDEARRANGHMRWGFFEDDRLFDADFARMIEDCHNHCEWKGKGSAGNDQAVATQSMAGGPGRGSGSFASWTGSVSSSEPSDCPPGAECVKVIAEAPPPDPPGWGAGFNGPKGLIAFQHSLRFLRGADLIQLTIGHGIEFDGISIDRFGRFYITGGLQAPPGYNVSLTGIWMNQMTLAPPTADAVQQFSTENSFAVSGGFLFGAGEMWVPGSGTGTEVGLFTPQVGISWGYTYGPYGGNK